MTHPTPSALGGFILVHSAQRGPWYLQHQINEFIDSMKEKFATLTAEEFEVARQSVITIKSEKDLSLAEEGARHWREVYRASADF